ncbi:class I SAM-dependent methyltransferase [Halioxenophilus aromaticivorans]|uniref:Class I SAM-dependent methyltransferase n=1 Tax=Halioxenophilus aromaticivorans TaxID=1306992 RepID=A0AAV3TWB0_9ALTE
MNCQLVCVPSDYWLSSSQERVEYDLHENDLSDAGYRRFLSRIFNPVQKLLPDSASGLDFGCGPAPALADMFSSAGHSMALYDKFYADDKSVLEASYDFVTASEVVEHLQQPKDTLIQLWQCVRPGGYLAIMTKRWISQERFANWHYKNDPTHVVFFHLVTFMWLAAHLNGRLTVWSDDVVIMRKPLASIE